MDSAAALAIQKPRHILTAAGVVLEYVRWGVVPALVIASGSAKPRGLFYRFFFTPVRLPLALSLAVQSLPPEG